MNTESNENEKSGYKQFHLNLPEKTGVLHLGGYHIEPVLGEPFQIVCPRNEKEAESLFCHFKEEMDAGVKQSKDSGSSCSHIIWDIGCSTTHHFIFSGWIFKSRGDVFVMPFLMLARPNMVNKSIKRIRAIWDRCTDAKHPSQPPWTTRFQTKLHGDN
jgi:hypothetical protein